MLGYACFQNLIVAAVARHSLKSTQCVSGIVLNGGMALSAYYPSSDWQYYKHTGYIVWPDTKSIVQA